MTTTTRTRITATPLYPGSFYPEDGRPVQIPDADSSTALAAVGDDDGWFAIEVRTRLEKRWEDGAGGVMWQPTGSSNSYRIYVGEVPVADVERLDGDHSILLSNMRGNGWERVVLTRRGNFQPLESGDVVLSPAEVAR